MDYNDLETQQICAYDTQYKKWVTDPFDQITAQEFINGEYEMHYTELGLVEEWGEENGLMSSEIEVSDAFDDMIRETLPVEEWIKMRWDAPAISETFSGWMDGLCKDGEIHMVQYNEYTYVNDFNDIHDDTDWNL